MRLLEHIQERLPQDHFSKVELDNLLSGSEDSRCGLVKRAVANGELLRLRRGFYCLASRYQRHPLNLFVLAQRIYGPSYITAESALSYHGWIPEAVPAITSATTKRARDFKTPIGFFSYRRVLSVPFYTGVHRESSEGDSFFMASPLKALLDFVFIYKKEWKGIKPLLQSLRIDEEHLMRLQPDELKDLAGSYRSQRVQKFLSSIRKDLSPWR